MRIVADVDTAIAAVGLRPGQRVSDLTGPDRIAFRRLVGWEEGGPIVAPGTPAERAARAARQRWKAARLDQQRVAPRLLFGTPQIQRARQVLATGAAPDWLERLLSTARDVAALGLNRLLPLIPERAPWNAAGSFCPACFGRRSDVATHAPFWRWCVDDPGSITCPHCDTRFPHAEFPETGHLVLPRLGLSYTFYLSPDQQQRDWRDGAGASSFGGGPTHVSLSGEIERCALNWLLGQLEPMALAAAITGEAQLGDVVRALFVRLAEVYPAYPLYSYRQEYYDCEPAYAVEHCNEIPTPFRRAACSYTYDGRFAGAADLHGRGDNTVGSCRYPNAEWGCSRMAREKSSHGQLFLSLLHAWDLVAEGCTADTQNRVEGDLLLEYYLDVKGLTTRTDNKSGPGIAARVAAGLMWQDEDEITDGVERFQRLLTEQFYADGSWKETPIYGAKALVEGLWEVPELLHARGLYDDTPVLRRAFEVYAAVATPCGTQPTLDDSAADFSLPAHLRDLGHLRFGVHVPAAPEQLRAFGPTRCGRSGFGGYVPRLDMVPEATNRLPGDGGMGFAAVGHLQRKAPQVSWVPLFFQDVPVHADERQAYSGYFHGRGLACMGAGCGPTATQFYIDGGDGADHGHRHAAPLSLMGFHDGIEVFADLGYIADHPANAWVRATASHNTVLLDGRSVQATARGELAASVTAGDIRFVDLRVAVQTADCGPVVRADYRRAVVLLPGAHGQVMLVDVFDAEGDASFDYVCRAGAPGPHARIDGLSWRPRQQNLFADSWATPPWDPQTAGPCDGFDILWPGPVPVAARILQPSDEVVRFRSPAWRTQADVFAAPKLAWTAIACRQVGPQVRFVTVFCLGGPAGQIESQSTATRGPVDLTIRSDRLTWHVQVGDGTVSAEGVDT